MKAKDLFSVMLVCLSCLGWSQLSQNLTGGPTQIVLEPDPGGDLGNVLITPLVSANDAGLQTGVRVESNALQIDPYYAYRQLRPVRATWKLTWSTEDPFPHLPPPRGVMLLYSRDLGKNIGELRPVGNTFGLTGFTTICVNIGPAGREYELTPPSEWRNGFLESLAGISGTISNPYLGIEPINKIFLPIKLEQWIPVPGFSYTWTADIELTSVGMSGWVSGSGDQSELGEVLSQSLAEPSSALDWQDAVLQTFPVFNLQYNSSTFFNNDGYDGKRIITIEYGDINGGGSLGAYKSYLPSAISTVSGPPDISSSQSFNVLISSRSALRKLIQISTSTNDSTINTYSYDPVLGDIDQDNEIGASDYSLMSVAFGLTVDDWNWHKLIDAGNVGSPYDCDLDSDGEVGPSDVAILITNFGEAGDDLP